MNLIVTFNRTSMESKRDVERDPCRARIDF